VNLAVASFIHACQFLRYEPVPREHGPVTPSPQQSYEQVIVRTAMIAQDPED
jgi:hypothetical protein